MATFKAVWSPKSQTGGISDAQNATVAATNGTASINVGKRQIIQITVSGSIYMRFSSGSSTAAATDMPIFSGILYEFDTGDEFNYVNFFNNGASSVVVGVMRMTRA